MKPLRQSAAVRFGAAIATVWLATCCDSRPAMAHPFHVSIGEAEWNPKTRRLEVALRVHPADLDRALRKADRDRQQPPTLEGDQRISRYLQSVFVVRYRDGAALKFTWIGKELSVKSAWLYFEIELPNGLDGALISNRLFFEIEKKQTNTVNFTVGERRESLSFSAERPVHKLGSRSS